MREKRVYEDEVERRVQRDSARKIFRGVLDDSTLYSLYKLGKRLSIKKFYGIVKSGKESAVILAEGEEIIAIKIYSMTASNFTHFKKYITGDERFARVKPDRRSIMFAWCQKEFRNLHIAQEAGVSCPKPIAFRENALAMEFIGEGTQPAPRLVDTAPENPAGVINAIVESIRKLYSKRLVHGDLSPYNILLKDNTPVLIDFSQGVLLSHPLAQELLERDIRNISSYAQKLGIEISGEEIYRDLK